MKSLTLSTPELFSGNNVEQYKEHNKRTPTLNPMMERVRNTILGNVYGSSWAYTNQLRATGEQMDFPSRLQIAPTIELGLHLNSSIKEISSWNVLKLLDPVNFRDLDVNQQILRALFGSYMSNWTKDKRSDFDVPEYLFDALYTLGKQPAGFSESTLYANKNAKDGLVYRGWLPLWKLGHNQVIASEILQAQLTHGNPIVLASVGLFASYIWHNSRNLGPEGFRSQDLFEWGIEQCYSLASVFDNYTGEKVQYGFFELSKLLKEAQRFVETKTNFTGLSIFSNYHMFSTNEAANSLITALCSYHIYNKQPGEEILMTVLDGTNNNVTITGLVGELIGSSGKEFPSSWYKTIDGLTQDSLFHVWKTIEELKFIQTPYTDHDEHGKPRI